MIPIASNEVNFYKLIISSQIKLLGLKTLQVPQFARLIIP